jgi:hypothetical protein
MRCCLKVSSLICLIFTLFMTYFLIRLHSSVHLLLSTSGLTLSGFDVDSDGGSRLVDWMKDGRITALLRETTDRVIQVNTGGGLYTRTLVDVSHSREAGLLIRRMSSRFPPVSPPEISRGGNEEELFPPGPLPFSRLVVDIGANDGLLSSNSFNLAQLGWSTVLVEPNPSQLSLAKSNQSPYIDVYSTGSQTACYLEAAVTPDDKDGTADLFLTSDAAGMESHLKASQTPGQRKRAETLRGGAAFDRLENTIKVETLSVGTIAKRCKVPKRFGLLR